MEENVSYELKPSDEIAARMPSSFQLMIEIEAIAQAAFDDIRAAIDRGETTIEAVLKERGITGGA